MHHSLSSTAVLYKCASLGNCGVFLVNAAFYTIFSVLQDTLTKQISVPDEFKDLLSVSYDAQIGTESLDK